MNLVIPVVNIIDRFEKWIFFLTPILKVDNPNDRKLLASYMVLFNKYKDYRKDVLYSLLFSEETSGIIQKNLGISQKAFKRSYERLQGKGLILNNTLNDKLLYCIVKQDWRLDIHFKEV